MDAPMSEGVLTPVGSPRASQTLQPPPFGGAAASSGSSDALEDQIQLVTATNFDLDTYLPNYSGHTRIIRLEFIGDRCPPLRVEAYQQALKELQGTLNTEGYQRVLRKLNDHLSSTGAPTLVPDQQWIASAHRTATVKQEKLENELKQYKQNMIKESIRMGHNDLGDYFYQRGDLVNALRSYMRTREYCTSSKHITTMCLSVIRTSVEMGNFAHVLTHVSKAETTPDIETQPILIAKLKAAAGLAQLESKNYNLAARHFIDTSYEIEGHFNDVISSQDVGTYGGLCALASFDRGEIRTKIIDNPNFKQILELTPVIRQIIEDFYHSKYASCLKSLQQIQSELLLDIHLHDHLKKLYQDIRKKALIQYFSPFQSIDLNKMAATFNVSLQELEAELAGMIMEKHIQGRIDSHNKILYARRSNQRAGTFEKAVETGDQFQRSTKALILRVNMIKADFVVRPPKIENPMAMGMAMPMPMG